MVERARGVTLFTVPSIDNREYSSFQGQFSFDEISGYSGHYFLNDYQIVKRGHFTFDIPDHLTKPFIHIQTEDGHYATICFMKIGQRSWRNMQSLRVEFAFRYLLYDVGISDDESCVCALTVHSPSLASIVGIRPVTQSFDLPNTGGTATFALSETKKWDGTDFSVEIADRRNIGASSDHSEVHFRSDICLALRYKCAKRPSEIFYHLRMIEDMLSVLSGQYVKIKSIWLDIKLEHEGANEEEEFQLAGYDTGSQINEFVGWHETLCHYGLHQNWAGIIEKFAQIWKENEIPFKWFRSSQIQKRYLEEKYSYTVRLIERFFRAPSKDRSNERYILNTLLQRSNEDERLVSFLNGRFAPLLTDNSSLTDILRELYKNYPEIKAFSSIRPQEAVRLRGKEMHGANNNYSSVEYGAMYDLTRSFMYVFRLAILEKCGFGKEEIFERSKHNNFQDLLLA